MWFLFVLLLSFPLFSIIFTWFYFRLCIVGSNMGVDENAETINQEYFERTIEHQVSHPQTIILVIE